MTTSPQTPVEPVWRVDRAEWTPAGFGLLAVLFMAGAPSALLTYAGLDPSWGLAVNMARVDHFEFGRDFIFTYGPWGFLDHPAPVGNWYFLMAVVYTVLATAALYATSYVGLRRRWELSPFLAAVASAAITAILAGAVERSAVAAAACGLAALLHSMARAEGAHPRGSVTRLTIVLAVVAGLLVQVKLSVGVVVVVVALLTALGGLSVRRVVLDILTTGVAFVVSFLLFWLIAGQSLSWLRDVVAGLDRDRQGATPRRWRSSARTTSSATSSWWPWRRSSRSGSHAWPAGSACAAPSCRPWSLPPWAGSASRPGSPATTTTSRSSSSSSPQRSSRSPRWPATVPRR